MVSTIATILGGIVLMLGLGSKWLQKTPVPPTLLALCIGILLGPEVFGVIDLAALGEKSVILENAARLTLAIGLVSVALRIPKMFPRQNWREMLVLIGAGMLLMWSISTALLYVILDMPFWLAALIGAIITPTDPIAATPIVTGEVAEHNLPERLRHTISFESGANDGLGYLLIFLPLLMLTRSPEEAFSHWLLHSVLWQVVGATLFGLLLGYAAAKLLQAAEARDLIQEDWRLVYTVALALLAVGAGKLIHSDEVLVVFAAGVAFVQAVSIARHGDSLGRMGRTRLERRAACGGRVAAPPSASAIPAQGFSSERTQHARRFISRVVRADHCRCHLLWCAGRASFT